MPITATQYPLQGLMPAHSPNLATTRPVVLPIGGPRGSGGEYAAGAALGCIGGAQASEVRTLTLSGASGTVTVTLTFDRPYVVSFAYNASTTAVQTAFTTAIPLWYGNVTIGGTAGSSYTVTFGGQLANMRIGGAWAATVTSGTASWAITTSGCAGALQFDAYNSSTNNRVDAFLENAWGSNPIGGRTSEFVSGVGPVFPTAWIRGYFNYSQLVGMDSNALSLSKISVGSQGLTATDAGLIVELL